MVDGKLTNSPVQIINMWFEHFKCLGIPSPKVIMTLCFVTSLVQRITSDFSNSSNRFDLNGPIEESEVVSVFQGLAGSTAGGICQTTSDNILAC